jgi:site-specific DNA-methyltransferase (adenine-specific)
MQGKSPQWKFILPKGLKLNTRQKMDGLELLRKLHSSCVPLVLFDPQYRGILDKQRYGNEGSRLKGRFHLNQMSDEIIREFFLQIERVLIPSGHVMLWVDKFILLNTLKSLASQTSLQIVDMITWDKERIGLGYRSRRKSEYLVIFQKPPIRAKGVWTVRNIPDVWSEKIANRPHVHSKPVKLQQELILAVTRPFDVVVDPCAGGYSSLEAAKMTGRRFLGCDIKA